MARPTFLLLLLAISSHHAAGFSLAIRMIRADVNGGPRPSPRPRGHRRNVRPQQQQQAPGLSPGAPSVQRAVRAAASFERVPMLLAATEEAADKAAEAVAAPPPPPPPSPAASAAEASRGLSLVASGASLTAIVVAEFALRKAFVRAGLAFPASLAGMVGLFAGMVALERAAPESAEKGVRLLEPGAALLARWLPVFFAPSLVVLPLSPAPSSANALKLLLLVCGGWFMSLASTAAVVTTLSPGVGGAPAADDTAPDGTQNKPAPPHVFRGAFVRGLGVGAAVSGVIAVAGASSAPSAAAAAGAAPGVLAKLSKPATQLSLLLATLFGFTAGTRLPRRVSKAVHPVVTCAAVAMAAAAAIGRGVGLSFAEMLRSYLTKSRCPVHLGAGDVLLGLLGPSVLSFAVQMYRRRTLIFKNARQVAGGAMFSASSGLFGTALVSRLLDLPTNLRLATLSRNITSPLAMAICSLVGADPSLAIAVVVITGVIGANFGATALDALGVTDPAARGLSQGGSSHGLGTAAMVNEPTCFAFSAVAMALTATASTVLVSIPPVRSALLRLALGTAAAASSAGAPPLP